MTRRDRIRWAMAAAVFTVVNLVAAVAAGLASEMGHAGGHVATAVLGACIAWWLIPKRPDGGSPWGKAVGDAPADGPTDRLSNLEMSVDAVAVEVERIGEGQRYMTRMLSEQGKPQVPAEEAKAKPPVPPNVRRD